VRRARARFGARELRIARAPSGELLPARDACRMICVIASCSSSNGAKRLFFHACSAIHGETLEDRAELRDELALAERVRLLEPHAR